MDTLWLMCGIAVVAVGLIMMIGGSNSKSLDDVYARRAQARRDETPAGTSAEDTDGSGAIAQPADPGGRHRVVA